MALRRKLSDQAGPAAWPSQDLSFRERFPNLVEFLSLTTVDGAARETGTLTVSVDGGTLKGCLRDRDVDDYCWFSASTMEELLDFAERAVQGDPRADWRANRGPFKAAGRGRKRN